MLKNKNAISILDNVTLLTGSFLQNDSGENSIIALPELCSHSEGNLWVLRKTFQLISVNVEE
jgi:hypothetical protein